jgi:glycosyltransferase involved in cell wall biosynthesis
MNIGVDAYYLSAERIDGLGMFLLRLLRELSGMDHGNYYYLYTPDVTHAEYADHILRNRRFRVRRVTGVFRNRRRLWLQSPSLRKAVMRDRIDMFFAGAEYFPLFLPRSIFVATVVHDVAYKAMPEAISFANGIFYNHLFPLFIKRTDQFFTVSNHSKREMVSYLNTGQKKIHVIYNGIDLKKYSRVKSRNKKNYLLFVGTLQPRKNIVNLVKAYSYISDRIDETLIIVGARGWKDTPLREVIQELRDPVKRRIIFKGYVAEDELLRLYREAKLFVLPSLHEGFCLPILESMAAGTAVLTARRTAIPEVFGDAVRYADPFSPDDIANKIYELVTNDKLRVRLEKKGLALSKNYDVKSQAASYLDAFRAIAAKLEKG